ISEISRIVESNDCTILHLNTIVHPETGMLTVTIHINKREIATVISTFERYDYHVSFYFGIQHFENEIDSNYRNFMHYLDI
nr:CBS domain-containing protein [Ferruginibacter sp.]